MLDIKFIRENKDLVKENCKNRHVSLDVDELLKLDEQRRASQQEVEALRAQRKGQSKGKPSEEDIARLRKMGDEISALEKAMEEVENKYRELLLRVPNLTHPESPIGGEEDYKVVVKKGKVPEFSFPPKDHDQLMTDLDLIDFERGAKVATSKFYFAKNNFEVYGLDYAKNVIKYCSKLKEEKNLQIR